MIYLFNFSSNDQSLVYLAQLFGGMSGIIPGAPNTVALLGSMFRTFNSVILAVGALVVVYTTVVGVMLTAHEGQFMGKNWNNMWIPIRTVLGIAFLVPTTSGYSSIQLVLMWVIIQGIGAADTLWNTVLTYVSVTGSPYTAVAIPSMGTSQTMGQLFQGLTCDEAARKTYANPMGEVEGNYGSYYCQGRSGGFCGAAPPFNRNVAFYAMGPSFSCGIMIHCLEAVACADTSTDTGNLKCLSCRAQLDSLASIIPVLRGIARDFVEKDYTYYNYWARTFIPIPGLGGGGGPPTAPSWLQNYCSDNNISPCMGPFLPLPGLFESNPKPAAVTGVIWPYAMQPTYGDGNFLSTNTSLYMNNISDVVNNYLRQQMQDNTNINPDLQAAANNGWILAGSYYYTIAQMTSNNLSSAMPVFIVIGGSPRTNENNVMNRYRNNYDAAAKLVSAASGLGSTSSLESATEGLGGVSDLTGSAMQSVGNSFGNNVSSSGSNPIATLAGVGKAMIVVAEILFSAFLILTAYLTGIGYFNVFVLGTGVNNPVGPMVSTMYFLIVPTVLALIGVLITFGGLLSVYLPLVPYIIFSFGAISWLISTIETMIAGPLVALGVLSPSGQHELLGKAEPALMLVFYVFLKPSLMIFGLMSAMLLCNVVKGMIDTAYWQVAKSIWGDWYDPLAYILFLGSYVFFIIGAFNKCFAAIYLLPNQVMGWIGGSHAAREGGEAGAEQELKGGFQKTAGGTAGAYGGAFEKVKATREGQQKAKDAEGRDADGMKIKPSESKEGGDKKEGEGGGGDKGEGDKK